ncbi:MAG: NAD(P)H-binding protein [Terracidiphilus sp.]|nr:NAD(P)H-binding protein [Terracidiphilus sp.]
MKILIFGATGMVGQGVLRECLRDPDVERVGAMGRTVTGVQDPKLWEMVRADLSDFSDIEEELAGFDACFFVLGVSSSGMKEADYARVTYNLTVAAGEALSRVNPGMTFIYVSGAGTDSTEKGRVMWARVKGRTENALLRMPLKAYMFRPGLIQPLDGIKSKTPAYRVLYSLTKPLLPLLRWALPNQVTTTREMGQAMLAVAKHGYPSRILEARDLRAAVLLSC